MRQITGVLVTYDGSVSPLQVGLVVDVDDAWEQILGGETKRKGYG
jgi:hypothetical protein